MSPIVLQKKNIIFSLIKFFLSLSKLCIRKPVLLVALLFQCRSPHCHYPAPMNLFKMKKKNEWKTWKWKIFCIAVNKWISVSFVFLYSGRTRAQCPFALITIIHGSDYEIHTHTKDRHPSHPKQIQYIISFDPNKNMKRPKQQIHRRINEFTAHIYIHLLYI